jgi:superfamily II DNA or RNA helicase
MSEHDPALIDRAFQIADDAMFELLLSEGVIGDEAQDGGRLHERGLARRPQAGPRVRGDAGRVRLAEGARLRGAGRRRRRRVRTRQALRRSRRVLVQLPTGGGKTVIGSKMLANATAKGHRSWFLLHRRELVKQSILTLTEAAALPIGIVAAGFPGNRHQPVQVCSIGTLARRLDMLPAPTLMLWDECHHLAAASWSAIMAKYPDAVHIGLSATPERLDGAGLESFFDEMVCGPSVRELIDAGRLCDYKLYAPQGADLSGVHTVAATTTRKSSPSRCRSRASRATR